MGLKTSFGRQTSQSDAPPEDLRAVHGNGLDWNFQFSLIFRLCRIHLLPIYRTYDYYYLYSLIDMYTRLYKK